MSIFKNFDLGMLFLRFGLGVMLFMHGIAKVINGVDFIKSLLAKAGLPEFIAYFAYLGEVIAPMMLILGVLSRFASILVLGTCATILYLYYGSGLFELTNNGGFKAEIVYLYISMALCILFNGSGKYALKRD